jgi:hypothetical protein
MGIKPQPLPGVQYQIADTPKLVLQAQKLEFQVFSRYGLPGKGPRVTAFDSYPCLFYIALHETEGIVGVVRVIVPSPRGFYTTKMRLSAGWREKARQIEEQEQALSLPMSAVRKDFRTAGVFSCILNLYRLIYKHSLIHGNQWWFAPIDSKVFPHYVDTFHFQFQQIGPEQDCLGAPSVPAILEVEPAFRYLQEQDPDLAEFFFN